MNSNHSKSKNTKPLKESIHQTIVLWTQWPQLTQTIPLWQHPQFSRQLWAIVAVALQQLWRSYDWDHPDLHPGNVMVITNPENTLINLPVTTENFICVDWLEASERK